MNFQWQMCPIFNNSCIGSLNITKSPHGSLLFEDFPMVPRARGGHCVLGGLIVTNKIYITSHVLHNGSTLVNALIRIINIQHMRKSWWLAWWKPSRSLEIPYSELHMTLKCKDAKLRPISRCIVMTPPWRIERTNILPFLIDDESHYA
jgi:hypothetical protein